MQIRVATSEDIVLYTHKYTIELDKRELVEYGRIGDLMLIEQTGNGVGDVEQTVTPIIKLLKSENPHERISELLLWLAYVTRHIEDEMMNKVIRG